MRTTDQAAPSPSDSMALESRRTLNVGLRRLLVSVVRGLMLRTRRNNVQALSEHQLRDIGLSEGREQATDLMSRAQRQDERLRKAHQDALYLAIGLNGR
jgi:uncharacterized protein YjiS (DUF1127 family)